MKGILHIRRKKKTNVPQTVSVLILLNNRLSVAQQPTLRRSEFPSTAPEFELGGGGILLGLVFESGLQSACNCGKE